jgi:hypothetical protein
LRPFHSRFNNSARPPFTAWTACTAWLNGGVWQADLGSSSNTPQLSGISTLYHSSHPPHHSRTYKVLAITMSIQSEDPPNIVISRDYHFSLPKSSTSPSSAADGTASVTITLPSTEEEAAKLRRVLGCDLEKSFPGATSPVCKRQSTLVRTTSVKSLRKRWRSCVSLFPVRWAMPSLVRAT